MNHTDLHRARAAGAKGRLSLAFTAAAALTIAACSSIGEPRPERRSTHLGVVVGSDDSGASGTLSWKGIPYAKPPIGPLRWRAPQEADAWGDNPRITQRFGNACAQNGRIFGPGSNNTYDATIGTTLNTAVGDEDCLTLNIWRPADARKGLPVIAFVYGGSNVSGYSADPVYDGAALARRAGAVVVTLNYRLGVFGFFNLAQLKTGTDAANDSGNFALLDIQQALRFVQRNIDAFGGDPRNVTLMGQSAGAINVYALMTARSSAGLFHKAVPLSGGISLAGNLPAKSIPTLNPASAYAAQGGGLLGHLLVADAVVPDLAAAPAWAASRGAAGVAEYLRGKSAATILGTVLARGLNTSGPIPDGSFLPADPIGAIAAGNYQRVPVLAGMTGEEGKLFARLLPLLGGPSGFRVADADLFNLMARFTPGADAPKLTDIVDAAYLPVTTQGTGYNARTALLAGAFMGRARDNVLNTLAAQQPGVWYYQFNWAQEPAPWNDVYGAAHAFDLPFLFGNFGPSLFGRVIASDANRAGRMALSQAMMDSLGAFARSGDPNHAGLGVSWQPWPKQLIFDASASQLAVSSR
jgi:para-nitrobenzyl esterase